MIIFPNSKINIGLRVLQKREDGFHDIETLFYPIPVRDGLELIQSEVNSGSSQPADPSGNFHTSHDIQFTCSGAPIKGELNDNLCLRAARILKQDFPEIPSLRMHLHKVIPMGAGLGGGSSDAAHTLLLMNEKFRLQLSEAQLMHYASQIGSDCPFFILNKPCLGSGRGEILEPVTLDLSGFSMLLVYPGIHIDTTKAFTRLKPRSAGKSVREIIPLHPSQWKDELTNDFESGAREEFPEIGEIKQTLYRAGAYYASMTGSGSAVYGIFEKNKIPDLFPGRGYFQKKFQ